ncbi:hypothetical protein AaE_004963 [Aphanomyces astaci]|uniref:Uncharacterized protein n=1 Tax=Aphanomyces astaci TaxID=112090 RepID=A0A6A5AHP3_APHAT|nr:hypothetical protein AaE_004963 [Aphanomyces astaci]
MSPPNTSGIEAFLAASLLVTHPNGLGGLHDFPQTYLQTTREYSILLFEEVGVAQRELQPDRLVLQFRRDLWGPLGPVGRGSAVARLANWGLSTTRRSFKTSSESESSKCLALALCTHDLYWALAFELFLVQDTRLINGSLVPQSSNFVYANSTMQQVMTWASTILGLFGTIDARHIPCLDAMRVFFSKAQQAVDAAVATNDYAQVSFERLQLPWTCPAEWIGVPRFAGNILCDQFLVS